MRVVAEGDALLAPTITRRLVEEFVRRPRSASDPPELSELTEREREVLVQIAHGLSNAEIAALFVVSDGTLRRTSTACSRSSESAIECTP